MRVVDRLARREQDWRDLQLLLYRMEGKPLRKADPGEIIRLGELYRSACADLMLAEAHDLPRETVAYLHALVGRAHNAVYRARGFRLSDWGNVIFDQVPRRLRADPMLRLAFLTFWGLFFLNTLLAAARPGFAAKVVGSSTVETMEEMYDQPLDGSGDKRLNRNDSAMAGFYIFNNAGIGLRCYAMGLLFGLGSLWTLASEGIRIGVIFGHMATTPQAGNFFTFVTSHAPFELTAIVFAGAGGLRLGSGLILTQGQSRLASLRREAARSLPIVGVSVILFLLAAFLEGFVSASPLPYAVKAAIASISVAILITYVLLLGRTRPMPRESGPIWSDRTRVAENRLAAG
ncbi:stage II sporulation protein M [Tundrisphaera lichenicola]|uniref:stage II sporulation protein M n=1 Tax=Tundrisphaera lichenicola TaxID=2029860 RepID=UPI003EBCD7AC